MKWKAELIEHRKAKRIAIWFEKNQELIQRIKKLNNAKWSSTLGYGICQTMQKTD